MLGGEAPAIFTVKPPLPCHSGESKMECYWGTVLVIFTVLEYQVISDNVIWNRMIFGDSSVQLGNT